MPPSSFHDQVAEDLRDLFNNPDEFGKTCVWNGREMAFSEQPQTEYGGAPGLSESTRIITVRSRDMPGKPVVNGRVRIDGVSWAIVDIARPLEAYVLTLSRMSS